MEPVRLQQKKRNSRALVFAIPLLAILAVAAIYEYGYKQVQDEVSTTLETEKAKSKTLKKYIALIAEKPAFAKQLALLKEQRTSENIKLIEGQTPAIAAATLLNSVKTIITGHAGTISSERIEKPEAIGRYQMISVSLDAVVPETKALADVLYAVETQTPYLVVKELDIRVRALNDPRDLIVRLRVSALTAGK